MPNIEEKVVGMSFDNSKFQKNITPVIDGLDKLKSSLKLEGATKGLEDLDNAGKKFTLVNVGDAATAVSGKFVALATIGITALSNIVNKAVNAGESILRSLTVDPVKAGLAEYELKMGSIQTILANTARFNTGLPEVVASLEELNTYADKTIYNFGEMTKNIGLFTNAGIGIQDATSMIKGFSNEAAASGTTAAGAAGAAYQLSQALSAGTIRLMDWRSLTNVGMGNKNMQNGIIEIAQAMGKFNDETTTAEDAQGNFNASLEKNWFSADVMSTYLKIMAGDMDAASQAALGLSDAQIEGFRKQQQTAEEAATKVRTYTQLLGTLQEGVGSGWAQSFDIIIGDFNEATELWTGVNNTLGSLIGAASDARNKILNDWSDSGGRQFAIEAISSAFNTLLEILGPVKNAFESIFPPITGKQLADLTRDLRNFIDGLRPTSKALADIRGTAAGFFALIDIGRMILVGFIKMVANLLGVASEGAGGFLDFTSNVGYFIVRVRDAIKNGEGLTKFFSGLEKVIKTVAGGLGVVISFLVELVKGLAAVSSTGVDGFFDRLQDKFSSLKVFFSGIMVVVKAFGAAAKAVADFFAPFIQRIGELTKGLGSALSDAFSSGNFDNALDILNTGLLAGIGAMIYKFVTTTKEVFATLGTGGIKDTIKSVFGELGNTLQVLQSQIKSKVLVTIATAVLILTASVVALSLIDTGKLFIALGAITTMFLQLTGAMALMGNFDPKTIAKMTSLIAVMLALSAATLILSSAVSILSGIPLPQLISGVGGLAAVMAIMAGAMLLMSKAGPGAILGSAALLIASGGIVVLALAMKLFATLSWDDIGRGMVALGGSLAILAVGLTLMAASLPGAAALTIASVGIIIIASALKIFSTLSWDDIGRAMTTLGGTLAILAIGLTLMTAAIPGAAALVVASVGLVVVAGALKIFSTLSWDDIGRAMTILGATLAILAVGLTLMVAALPGAAALVVAAGALTILAPVLLILGSMSWEEIGTGIGALALALGVLAIAGIALLPAIPGLIGLGAAVLLMGAGMLAAGIGITAFGVGLTALSVGGAAAITVLVGAVSALATLIPFVAQQIGLGMIEIAKVIGGNGPAILEALTTILVSLIDAIIAVIPKVVDAIILLVTKLVEAAVVLIPLLVDTGMKLIIGILDGIANNIEKVVEKGTDVIVALLEGIGKAIPRLLEAGANLIIDFVNGVADTIRSKSAELNAAGTNVANAIVDGMTSGIRNGINTVVNAAKRMAQEALDSAKNLLGINSPSKEFEEVGMFSAQGFGGGITKFAKIATSAAVKMGANTLSALKGAMANAADSVSMGALDLQPKITPVLDLSRVEKGTKQMASMFNGQKLSVADATNNIRGISNEQSHYIRETNFNRRPSTEVNYNQVINSPKVVPAEELYRQSKNQMSIIRKELEEQNA